MRWLIGSGVLIVAVIAVLLVRELSGGDGAGAPAPRDRQQAGAGDTADDPGPAAGASRQGRRGIPSAPGGPWPPAAPGSSAGSPAGDRTRPSLGGVPAPPAVPAEVTDRSRPYDDRVDRVRDLWFGRDYEAAFASAAELLEEKPRDARALWVAVAAACMLGDGEQAQLYFDQVRIRDNPERASLAQRCRDAGIELNEQPVPPTP